MGKSSDTTTEKALRIAVDEAYLANEEEIVRSLASNNNPPQFTQIHQQAFRLVERSRELHTAPQLNNFLNEFSLSSDEGIVLMCLAEALLRIPDSATQSRLIHDKLSSADWWSHIGHSPSLLVNASAWGLVLTGSVLQPDYDAQLKAGQFLKVMFSRLGAPLIRNALQQAMQLLAEQFVAGETLSQAIQTCTKLNPNTICSYDMLGEAALTSADAENYLERYQSAILQLGKYKAQSEANTANHSISIKLSALHPRYEYAQSNRIEHELSPKLIELAQLAKQLDIDLTIDAEEASRLELLMECFKAAFTHPALKNWHGLGLAVQAYQKRALPQLRWLNHLARSQHKTIPLRLVKGAYWDTEIKQAQADGLQSYPVFTRKQSTDVSYLSCAHYLLENSQTFYPQFGSHNALTIASIQQMTSAYQRYEFQRLYGMGESLYNAYNQLAEQPKPCRIYVPVGLQVDLLPYLVRRMLENGANTSFVYQAGDPQIAITDLLTDPLEDIKRFKFSAHPAIPLPKKIYSERRNSSGINLNSPQQLRNTHRQLDIAATQQYSAAAANAQQQTRKIFSLADPQKIIGEVINTDAADIPMTIERAANAQTPWSQTAVDKRASMLEKAADLFEENKFTLMHLCIHEAGRCLHDAHNEIREAIDFCRYYAQQARKLFNTKAEYQGIVGEKNTGHWQGKGIFVCISPWNFPIAIFTGQIAAALVAGNSVIAKPATATPLCAMQVIKYLHQAGIPSNVLQCLFGPSEQLGQLLTNDVRISGVAFTGSVNTAQQINRNLAARNAPIASMIAETGGQNVMISDSSALPEQLVKDVIRSAFNSAGQRCSALRVLFVPEEIADNTLELIKGAMQQLTIGDPADEATDIGPVIDAKAREKLQQHIRYLESINAPLFQKPLPNSAANGVFFAPTMCELDNIQQLHGEVFGPILHIIRYQHENLNLLIESINQSGYGLTLGIHSRIQTTINYIKQRIKVGNIYINRDMIGAVVGSQPFGGCGLSGTGPKAGGPHYLTRFANEVTVSENTTAIGGNASLLMMDEHKT